MVDDLSFTAVDGSKSILRDIQVDRALQPHAHRGDALRAYLATPDLNLCLVNLPSYSPDFNADEAIWDWARQEATANLCLGTRAAVREKVGDFFARLSTRREEVKRRCRTVLQAQVEELMASNQTDLQRSAIADFTLASV